MLVFVLLVLGVVIIIIIGNKKTTRGPWWVNWGRTLKQHPRDILYPRTLRELRTQVRAHRCIKVIGSGHSWSALDRGAILLSMKHFRRLLKVDVSTNQVTVEAGITIHRLNQRLAAHGLSLPNQGTIDLQTIAGALATATHGSGRTGTMSSFIVGMSIVNARGHLVQVSADQLPAARVALGALGVVYSIRLQCVPFFASVDAYQLMSLNEVLLRLPDLRQASDFFQFLWNPYLAPDDVTAVKAHTSSKAFGGPLTYARDTLQEAEYRSSLQLDDPPGTPRRIENEVGVPLNLLPSALRALGEYLLRVRSSVGVTVRGSSIKVRFASAETGTLLSPAAQRDTAYISTSIVPDASGIKGVNQFIRELQTVLSPFDARPHWGKYYFLDREEALRLYGDNLVQFQKIRKQMDPHGKFLNPLLREWLN